MSDTPTPVPTTPSEPPKSGLLDLIERFGNKLPDPVTLFLLGTLFVMALSHVAASNKWSVLKRLPVPQTSVALDASGAPLLDAETGEPVREPSLDEEGNQIILWETQYTRMTPKLDDNDEPVFEFDPLLDANNEPVLDDDGKPVLDGTTKRPVLVAALNDKDKPIVVPESQSAENDVPVTFKPTSLLTRDGLYWAINSMVDNFTGFAPLGVVLVGMMGIGIAERTGLIASVLKAFMLVVPNWLLTPTMVFTGIMSSLTLDAGYVVLPPLAAALYKAVGRSPLAGLAAVFAGVAAGFNANLVITGLDPLLAGLSTEGAKIIDPDYKVGAQANWYFTAASTLVMTLAGWAITSLFVERRLSVKPPEAGGPVAPTAADLEAQRLTPVEVRASKIAGAVFAVVMLAIGALIFIPDAALYGLGGVFPRWVDVIVPILFFSFALPAVTYGIAAGTIKNDKDVAKLCIDSMAGMAPIIVLAFFAGQFIAYFDHSGLGGMLALAGGQALGQADMSPTALMIVFVGVVMVFNLFVGSMSAKYTLFAPIFIPMFMLVGISPELTQAAYRIGDSTTNIITPLNPYLIIILVFIQKYVKEAGMGTLISMMMPYTIFFTIVWIIMLVIWIQLGVDLGPQGPLTYTPAAP